MANYDSEVELYYAEVGKEGAPTLLEKAQMSGGAKLFDKLPVPETLAGKTIVFIAKSASYTIQSRAFKIESLREQEFSKEAVKEFRAVIDGKPSTIAIISMSKMKVNGKVVKYEAIGNRIKIGDTLYEGRKSANGVEFVRVH